MTPGDAENAREYVPLNELDAATVRVNISPLPTVFMFALAAVAGREEAAGAGPSGWKSAVRARMRERDYATLAPLADPGTTTWPNRLSGSCTPGLSTLEDELEAVAYAEVDAFVADVEEGWGDRPLESWLPVLRHPGRWLRDYAEAMRRAWSAIEPIWQRSQDLLEREVERVGVAVALGAVAQCVDALHPRSSIVGDEWRPRMRVSRLERLHVATEFLVTPLVVEDVCTVSDDNSNTLTQLAYPLPGAWRAFDEERLAPGSLEALLGVQRARILMRLDRSATAGDIAEAIFATPGAASYQLGALESAGLILRVRRGRNVVVERTARGSALLELYVD